MAREYKDPITGDPLSFSEHVSWKLQTSVIRTWWFLFGFTLITLACITTLNLKVMTWWNVLASYLAIFVEAIVGRSMFSQTRRDAVILREIHRLGAKDESHSYQDYKVDLESNEMLKEILAILYRLENG